MAENYEIEIKSLLGGKAQADALVARLKEHDPSCVRASVSSQLNHYFEGGDPAKVYERLSPKLSEEARAKMERIVKEGKKISVRTRGTGGEALIVMKASINADSSANGVMRLEVEESVPGYTLDQLDAEVLAAGYAYQAKWSRAREEYRTGDITVCLDKNAGYGYVAEFEKVIEGAAGADAAKAEVAALMDAVGAKELPQDRLERMFSFYNEHWADYYGTDKIFIVE